MAMLKKKHSKNWNKKSPNSLIWPKESLLKTGKCRIRIEMCLIWVKLINQVDLDCKVKTWFKVISSNNETSSTKMIGIRFGRMSCLESSRRRRASRAQSRKDFPNPIGFTLKVINRDRHRISSQIANNQRRYLLKLLNQCAAENWWIN